MSGGHPPRNRLPVERARRLLALGLVALCGVLLWLRLLADDPHLPLVLRPAADGQVVLVASSDAALQRLIGQPLQALALPDGTTEPAGRALLPQSARWTVDDADRQALLAWHARLDAALHASGAVVEAVFADGTRLPVAARPRGLAGLGTLCWALAALALGLLLAALRTLLTQPGTAARLYLVLAGAQALQLLLIAASTRPGMGVLGPGWPPPHLLRLALDAVSAAALVHVVALHPQRPRRPHAAGLAAWAVAAGVTLWLVLADPPGQWWWAEALTLAGGITAAALLRPRADQVRSPMARLLQRLVVAGTATRLLLDLAVALDRRDMPDAVANLGTVAWTVFFASLLLLAPFLSRARQVLREFMLLAGACTVAASLSLLCLAVLGLHPAGALVLALAVSLGAYALARPWVLGQLAGPAALGAERMFDSLYRAARALEQSPGEAARAMSALLRELFDPLELTRSQRLASRVRVASDGATLVVPVPRPVPLTGQTRAADAPDAVGAIVLRHARQGRRLFTAADAQLCERLLEQLRRAVAHDRAVEHGRAEERARIAQDLHDDIGARLLTLMYKAPDPEIEDYIRHTLQDLKTLTRGLAASDQRLSHAAAEWKADITQRLAVGGCTLAWHFSADRDLRLTAVQWSGLTRVLRELVSNVIAHAQASHVEIHLALEGGVLQLVVSDDGTGTAPETWAHGLGLGGVRKRVKLLGGRVAWRAREVRGVRCEVTAPLLDAAGVAAQAEMRPGR